MEFYTESASECDITILTEICTWFKPFWSLEELPFLVSYVGEEQVAVRQMVRRILRPNMICSDFLSKPPQRQWLPCPSSYNLKEQMSWATGRGKIQKGVCYQTIGESLRERNKAELLWNKHRSQRCGTIKASYFWVKTFFRFWPVGEVS